MRAVAGFLAGWLAMGLVVFGLFLVGPLVLGIERVFEPGLYQATPLWIGLAMGIGLLGAMLGGWVAARLGRGRGPAVALAVLVVVSTILSELSRKPETDATAVRPPGQSVLEVLMESREHAFEPLVTRVTNPIVGLLGLWLGASLALRGARRRED